MKKVILSAFAMSLMLVSLGIAAQTEAIDDFFGLETEILPDLQGPQRFTTPNLHEADSWKVQPETTLKDVPLPPKGQGHSIIPWKDLDPEGWMNIHTWIQERKVKDENPDWLVRLRLADQKELMGKVLQCQGTCYVYRGTDRANVRHLSRILEGDEFHTDKDSVAWIFMMDGSLVRLSPETSISFQEVNIAKNEFLFLARLNEGHIYWNHRGKNEIPVELAPETDSFSLPLLVREANQAHFEREIFQAQKDLGHLAEVMELDEGAMKAQFKALNELKAKQNEALTLSTKVMIVAPNSSLVTRGASFDYMYFPGEKSYFKKRTSLEGEEFFLHMRGYNVTEAITIGQNLWYEVDKSGRTFIPTEVTGTLQVLELLTKRIKSIELAREIWIRDFTLPVVLSSQNAKLLAEEHGYHLWGNELNERLDFLVEYTRRIETTHIKSLENLVAKLESKGEKITKELTEESYRVSLNHYLLGLKSRYDNKKMQVREMNDLQYYVWILKNGKF